MRRRHGGNVGSAHNADGTLTASTVVNLLFGERASSASFPEWFGTPLGTGAYLHIMSANPVQMLGMLGNESTGTVMPVVVTILRAPAPPPPPDSGVPSGNSGKGH